MRRWLIGGLIAVAVLLAVYGFVVRTGPVPVTGLAAPPSPAFDAEGRIDGGRARYSADGTRLAVLSSAGVSIADEGRLRAVTAEGANVVDAAWFPAGSAFLVAEGPLPTGTLAVVETDGSVRGNIALTPSVGFGSGYGMAVSPGGRQAVVTGVERPALEREQRYLVVVDLETGATRPLTEPGGADESNPVYLDAATVVFEEEPVPEPGATEVEEPSVVSIELSTGEREVLSRRSRLAGVVGGGNEVAIAVTRGREIVMLAGRRGNEDFTLGSLPEGAALTAVHPAGGEAVVRELQISADGSQASGLRRIRVRALPRL